MIRSSWSIKYELSPLDAECPVCGHHDCRRLYSVTPEAAAQHYVLREVEPDRYAALLDHIRELWGNKDCKLVCCSSCQFGFAVPFKSGSPDFYSLAYKYGADKYPRNKWEYDETIRMLQHRRSRQNRYLEIGAGSGAFVKKLIPDFVKPEDATCIEYSSNGAKAIRAMGIECLDQNVCSASELDGRKFDIICLFQVLEHMDDLDRFFERISDLAAPRCDIFIAVPNPLRTEYQELRGSILDLPPNHVGRWTCRCFEIIAQKFGLLLISCQVNRSQSFSEKAKRFIKFTYLRRTQEVTMANRIEQVRNTGLKKLLRLFASGFYAIGNILDIVRCREPELGDSLLAHLRKPPDLSEPEKP
jgi:2-polyprenyl-3-methyl-5-hydroxy-6-metoxy-1,4-benzoquinol methylase